MIKDHNVVGWFEIYVQDLERAKAFYEKTLQVKLERLDSPSVAEHRGDHPDLEMWAFPMLHGKSGCPGALCKMAGKDPGRGGTIIYFVCEDCAVEAKRAAENGGRIEKEKFSIGQYGNIAFVSDTEGNWIGLHSMK